MDLSQKNVATLMWQNVDKLILHYTFFCVSYIEIKEYQEKAEKSFQTTGYGEKCSATDIEEDLFVLS